MEIRWLKIVRDIVSILIGAFGLVHSQITGHQSTELLVVYTALLGYPGVLQLAELGKRKKDAPDVGK